MISWSAILFLLCINNEEAQVIVSNKYSGLINQTPTFLASSQPVWTVDTTAKFPTYSKYLNELAAGYVLGGIGWCIGTILGYAIWGTEDAALIGGFSLYTLGATFGVWKVGQQYDESRYFTTLIGAVSFPLVLIGAKRVLKIKSSEFDKLIGFSLPIGAFIGYNLSKKEVIVEPRKKL
ncbi:MAG: hypothetical protein QMD71_06125 [bacterium]|nr:hypothetical protein [bacterium]